VKQVPLTGKTTGNDAQVNTNTALDTWIINDSQKKNQKGRRVISAITQTHNGQEQY